MNEDPRQHRTWHDQPDDREGESRSSEVAAERHALPDRVPDQVTAGSPVPVPALGGITEGVPHAPVQASGGVLDTLRRMAGPVLAIAFLLLKFGKYAFIAIKGMKFFTTAGTMLVSIVAYSFIFGWAFAAGFVVLILVHELGHALQLRREGVAAGAPVFIPLVGAAIAMKELPRDAAMEARVGLAGPIVGSLGALVVYQASLQLDSMLLQAIAFTGFFINLFNLLPVSPLDGGRAMAALSPTLWLVGIVLLAGIAVMSPNPLLLLILLLGGLETWRRWKTRHDDAAYYQSVTGRQRAGIAATYLGLVVSLVVLMAVSHVPASIPSS